MKKQVFSLAFFFCAWLSCSGQTMPKMPSFSFDKGIGIVAADSLFSMNLRFRMQNRIAFKVNESDIFDISEVEARVRRMRLRMDGFIYNARLTYLLQFSFARPDMDTETLGIPNILRDAYIQYAFNKKFSVGFGQAKLPGNRQRINSSADLQFADRSMVSNALNIDRDFGLFLNYKSNYVTMRGAVSSGEGRNMNVSDKGLAYTGRVEFLPLGAFTNGGDYFEGDLEREKKPRISIGASYSHNENATRTGGQLGSMLYGKTDIDTHVLDFLYKYRGWSFAGEFMRRTSPNAITTNDKGEQRFVYVGYGHNYQGGYNFTNNLEIVGRYSVLVPGQPIETLQKQTEQYTMGLNKYLNGHRVKVQNSMTLERVIDSISTTKNWIYCFQIEMGI